MNRLFFVTGLLLWAAALALAFELSTGTLNCGISRADRIVAIICAVR